MGFTHFEWIIVHGFVVFCDDRNIILNLVYGQGVLQAGCTALTLFEQCVHSLSLLASLS